MAGATVDAGVLPLEGIGEITANANAAYSGQAMLQSIGELVAQPSTIVGGNVTLGGNSALVANNGLLDTEYANLQGIGSLRLTPTVSRYGTTTLYIAASVPQSAKMNLFLSNPSKSFNSTISGVPSSYKTLFTLGASASGLQTSRPLAIFGTGNTAKLNLFMKGVNVGTVPNNMNLYVQGQNYSVSKSTPLFIQNTTNGLTNSIPLNINAYSWWPGGGTTPPVAGMPNSGTMNLFIKRWPSSAIPLYIAAPSPVNTSIPMYIKAINSLNLSLTLAMIAPKGSGLMNTSLFVSGW